MVPVLTACATGVHRAVTMAVEWLTYSDIGGRLGCSAEAARARAIRHEWPRRTGNDGRTECKIDIEEFVAAIPPYRREKPAERPVDAQPTPEPDPVEPPSDARAIEALEQHIATLKGFVAVAEAMAAKAEQRAVTADARTEFERGRADVERARADRERDKADTLAAKLAVLRANGAEQTASFERNLADLRTLVDGLQRPWWKRLARG